VGLVEWGQQDKMHGDEMMTTQGEILKYLAESPHTTLEIVAYAGNDTLETLRILELTKLVKYRTDKGLWYLNETTNA
jgi:hypothetical protein